MEDWITIRNLKKRNPRLGSRKIAELLGISRNTVKRALAMETEPTYSREQQTNPDIEPFSEFVKESYLVKKYKVSRIFKDLQSKGFTGSRRAGAVEGPPRCGWPSGAAASNTSGFPSSSQ